MHVEGDRLGEEKDWQQKQPRPRDNNTHGPATQDIEHKQE